MKKYIISGLIVLLLVISIIVVKISNSNVNNEDLVKVKVAEPTLT